jgi:hypothetical protein
MVSRPAGQKYEPLSEKQTKSKRTGSVAQVVDCLPSKVKVLSSNPSTTKKTQKLRCYLPLLVLTLVQ